MSRITQHIRLVLISSSLALHGCEHRVAMEPTCEQRPPENRPAQAGGQPGQQEPVPPVCGPVNTGTHPSRWYHHWYFWNWGRTSSVGSGIQSNVRSNTSSFSGSRGVGGKSAAVGGTSRGGFGGSAHGVSS